MKDIKNDKYLILIKLMCKVIIPLFMGWKMVYKNKNVKFAKNTHDTN